MHNDSPLTPSSNSQAIFAALRDALAALYPEESTARIVVADAGLDAKQITFSARAQTNWHNILAEAIRQARLDPLLKIVLADYAANPALLVAYGQYRLWIDQGGCLGAPMSLPADADVTVAGDVTLTEGDLVGRNKLIVGDNVGGDKVEGDKIDAPASVFLNRPAAPVTQHFGTAIHLGPLTISKPVVAALFTVLIAVVLLIGAIAIYTHTMSEAITAPTPTPIPTIPTAMPTRTPLPTATPLAFATQAVGETLIVIATFHNTAATDSEVHTKIRRAIADAAASNNEQQLRVEVEPTELTADQRTEAEALGNRYNASMVIWGEDTGVEVIVNFLNLKEPDFDAATATIIERERTQLANPSAYASFITQDLPRTMSFFAFFAIGQSYYLNGQYASARERIEAAVVMVLPNENLEGLAEAYFHLGWLYHFPTSNNLNRAIANYDQAIHLNPDFAIAYTNRGFAHFAQGKLGAAVADFSKVIQINPGDTFAYTNRGMAYSIQGKLDNAIADYDQAIKLNPNYAAAYNNRGNARSAQGKLDEAIADYDQAIQLNPNDAGAYSNRGIARFVQGKLDVAIVDFDKAIELDPDDAATYNNRGNAYAAQGKLDEAIADFDKAIQFNPNDDVYTKRGNARYDQGKLDEAIADYDKAIKLNPNNADAYNKRGNARSIQGHLDAAIADYDKAIKLNSTYAAAYNNRGIAYYDQGKLDEAMADFDQAIKLKSDYANAFWGRGLVYRTLGKSKEALVNFRRYLELQPNTEHRDLFEQWIAEAEAALAKQK